MYSIVRFYQNANIRSRVINSGLTLAQAQEHCNDPDSSSSTTTTKVGKARTHNLGAWFDGYTEDK